MEWFKKEKIGGSDACHHFILKMFAILGKYHSGWLAKFEKKRDMGLVEADAINPIINTLNVLKQEFLLTGVLLPTRKIRAVDQYTNRMKLFYDTRLPPKLIDVQVDETYKRIIDNNKNFIEAQRKKNFPVGKKPSFYVQELKYVISVNKKLESSVSLSRDSKINAIVGYQRNLAVMQQNNNDECSGRSKCFSAWLCKGLSLVVDFLLVLPAAIKMLESKRLYGRYAYWDNPQLKTTVKELYQKNNDEINRAPRLFFR